MDFETRVRDVICDVLSLEGDSLSDDSFLADDLGMTFDDLEELVTIFQDEYDIKIPVIDAEEWETVAAVMVYIQEKMDRG